ncbi:hypothetical protein [Sorangium sp. So ce341]|uniref:hypothetical protein n=1 Tax=Sorangium sp. So ce341 TaxID=3133302 RepID=UPI003F5E3C7C
MKKLALLNVASLMLVFTVFVPVAMAQEPGEVDVESVTLGPGGSVTVTGTIQCTEGDTYLVDVTVRQRTSGNLFNTAGGQDSGQCTATGPQAFTVTTFGERPFHRGPASVSTFGEVCPPEGFPCDRHEAVEAVRIR